MSMECWRSQLLRRNDLSERLLQLVRLKEGSITGSASYEAFSTKPVKTFMVMLYCRIGVTTRFTAVEQS